MQAIRRFNLLSLPISGETQSTPSGLRQHALLNLARMHYLHNEFTAARKVCMSHF